MTEKIFIWDRKSGIKSYIRPYLIDTEKPHGAVLILPGGGYHVVCEPSEGEPVAKGFNELGLHAFVLNYRVDPDRFPLPQTDAMRALKFIRGNAAKWNLRSGQLGVCGFSAGGHLAASIGTSMVENIDVSAGDEYDSFSARPDFIIAGQGVLSFADDVNEVTANYLLGPDHPYSERIKLSPELCVTDKTPPTFLWHTFTDQIVPYRCSVLFAEALKKHNVPCELHIFPRGDHGILRGLNTPDVSQWQKLARVFIAEQTGETVTPKEHYTHFYQCDASGTYPGKLREE